MNKLKTIVLRLLGKEPKKKPDSSIYPMF